MNEWIRTGTAMLELCGYSAAFQNSYLHTNFIINTLSGLYSTLNVTLCHVKGFPCVVHPLLTSY